MSGRIIPTPNTLSLQDLEKQSFVIAADGSPALAVTNTDGSSLGGGAGTVTGNVASGATDSGNPVKTGGVYNTTPPTVTNGQRVDTQADSQGNTKIYNAGLGAGEDLVSNVQGTLDLPVSSALYSPSFYQMPGTAVTAANIKSSAGAVLSFMVSNGNVAIRYLQIHNTTTAPAGGAVPFRSFPLPAGTVTNPAVLLIDKQYLSSELFCSTGISFAFSTTYLTYTAATATDHFIDLNYV